MTFRIGDEEQELLPGATWIIPANTPHSVRSGPNGATLVELFAPPRADWAGHRASPAKCATGLLASYASAKQCPVHAASATTSPTEMESRSSCASTTRPARERPRNRARRRSRSRRRSRASEKRRPSHCSGSARGAPTEADAVTIRPGDDHEHPHLEHVVDVRDEEELELALERLDPEIFLLTAGDVDDDVDPLDAVLELLPDVPAGKLAIAQVDVDEPGRGARSRARRDRRCPRLRGGRPRARGPSAGRRLRRATMAPW